MIASLRERLAVSFIVLFISLMSGHVRADDAVDLLGPSCGDDCADLFRVPPHVDPKGPSTGLSVLAEWLDKLAKTKVFSKVVTVIDFEAAAIRGYAECGPGCATIDVATKGIAALGGGAVAVTFGLALAELGPIGEVYAASMGIRFADQLERALRNEPGFDAARRDLGGKINAWLGWP